MIDGSFKFRKQKEKKEIEKDIKYNKFFIYGNKVMSYALAFGSGWSFSGAFYSQDIEDINSALYCGIFLASSGIAAYLLEKRSKKDLRSDRDKLSAIEKSLREEL